MCSSLFSWGECYEGLACPHQTECSPTVATGSHFSSLLPLLMGIFQMWAAEQGKRWCDWCAGSQEKLCLGTSQPGLHSGPFLGQGGEGKMKQGRSGDGWQWEGGAGVRVECGSPFNFCPSPLAPKGPPTRARGKGRAGRDAGGCSTLILGELSLEGSQLPLIKQANRTRGKAVFKTPSTF